MEDVIRKLKTQALETAHRQGVKIEDSNYLAGYIDALDDLIRECQKPKAQKASWFGSE